MNLISPTFGRQNSKSLVDKSTGGSTYPLIDIAKFKETQDIAEVLEVANGTKANLMDLYNEMWIFNQETNGN